MISGHTDIFQIKKNTAVKATALLRPLQQQLGKTCDC